jgi:hypothetical protein
VSLRSRTGDRRRLPRDRERGAIDPTADPTGRLLGVATLPAVFTVLAATYVHARPRAASAAGYVATEVAKEVP